MQRISADCACRADTSNPIGNFYEHKIAADSFLQRELGASCKRPALCTFPLKFSSEQGSLSNLPTCRLFQWHGGVKECVREANVSCAMNEWQRLTLTLTH